MKRRLLIALAALTGIVGIAAVGLYLRVELGWPIVHAVAAPDVSVDVTPERVARGRKLVGVRCAGCHYSQETNALTGTELVAEPSEFGTVFSANITRHPTQGTGRYSDGELVYLLRTGTKRDGVFPGMYMASPFLADEDIYSIIAFLRSDDPWVRPLDVQSKPSQWTFMYKALVTFAFPQPPMPSQPIPYPPEGDEVALGKYVVTAVADCFVCHSESFSTLDAEDPEKSAGYMGGGNPLLDARGRVVRGANITLDAETGIGNWTEDEFVRTVRTGIRPDKRPLRYPMLPYTDLSDREVRAVWAYLETIPPLRNEVPRDLEPPMADEARGAQVYRKYQCSSCHGDDGVGVCDLRQAYEHYPTDEALVAFMRDPKAFVPGTKMPAWDGIIAEDEWAPLLEYVRTLQRRN